MGEVIDTRLGAVLTVYGAGRGQLRWSVHWPSVGHIFRESTAADMAVVMAADVVVSIGRILREEQRKTTHQLHISSAFGAKGLKTYPFYFESVSSSKCFQFYLDVRSFVLLLFQEVAVFRARCPRRLTAVRSLREDQAVLKTY